MSQLLYVQFASQQMTVNVGLCILPGTKFRRTVCILVKTTARHRFVDHDRHPDAQHELVTLVALFAVQLYDHALTLEQEVNPASFLSSIAI